ncbi:MAG: hypothetical protein EOO13_02885 [Chitinophagaceae bacterium]|nr:MAG: hypothetical protein EOO13_02885 [Chitinophagaceae bacterium]
MTKKLLLLVWLTVLCCPFLQAQTWTGLAGTSWNTAGNWSTNAVPLATGVVNIPNTPNKPVLASNVTIASFNTQAGSALNVNGFSLTVTGASNIVGATFTNSNAATDIVITLSSGGAGTNYIGSSTFSDHTTINCNSSDGTYEGYSAGNSFSGNVIFNVGGIGRLYTCYSAKSSFSGNFSLNRTVAGITDLFNAGFNFISGNFTYVNNAGGDNYINSGNVPSGLISGAVNVTAGGTGNPSFYMRRLKNSTGGGTISVQNSGYTLIQNDTLLLNAMNINGFTGPNSDEFSSNFITGNVTFAEGNSNAGTVYVGNNTITGNTTLVTNFTATWYEGYSGICIYNGNTTFTLNGTGAFYSSYNQKCSFAGNLTVTRSAEGITDLLSAGFNFITGNLSYTNTAGGASYINSNNVLNGPINGTVNITATGPGNPAFYLRKIKNLTSGGTITVQNSGYTLIQQDTLLVTAMNISGFTGSSSDEMTNNLITGNVTFADGASNIGSVYVGNNNITGNTILALNFTATWYEGYSGTDVYNGNTIFNLNGAGTFYSSYSQRCSFGSNLTVNRTAAGTTYLLDNGFNYITGNLSYINTVGGASYINGNVVQSGPISGTLNVTATGPGNPPFYLRRIKNLTGGGTITVQNSGYTLIQRDTILVTNMDISGFTGSGSDELTDNIITGNVTFAEGVSNIGTVYVGNNTVNGNTVLSALGTGTNWYESYSGSDIFNGSVRLNRSGTANFNAAYSDTLYVNRDLIVDAAAGMDFNTGIEFGGNNNGIVEQLGSQPISTPRLILRKTGNAFITLNDSVTVLTAAGFVSGNIYSSIGNDLVFGPSATYTGASALSHVIGPVIKTGTAAFIFPVGGPVSLNTVAITAPAGTGSRFRALYKNQNPTSDGYNTALKAGSFGAAAISQAGYWDVQRLTGVTNVNVTLGFSSNPYEQYNPTANLKVAHWNGAQWDDHGNGGITGTAADGSIVNATTITSFSPFTIAGVVPTYFYVYGTPGAGPDGTAVKFTGLGGFPPYQTRQLPAGTYTADSIYLIPNGTSASFKLKDVYNVEKNDTTVTVPAAPNTYITANGTGTVNFTGWRHFVYLKNGSNQIIGAIRDNNLTLGNSSMTAYFSTPNVATAPNGNIYLKRSFKVTSQLAPAGTKRVRFYILKTEYNNLVAADPASFPNGINSLTITKYSGPQEDSLFNPIPGGNSIIIPNSDITIVDMGTMYSLDVDVSGFSGFYIGGNQSNVSLCGGATISIPSNITGATYQWQVNTGSGYTNIANAGVYSGATTKTLTLTAAPSSYYGYQYRAVVNGNTNSQVYTAKFTATWQGTVSNAWENPLNWNCGILPDANTDVLINTGKPNYPQVGTNTSIRTLRLAAGTTATVKTGFNLTITK